MRRRFHWDKKYLYWGITAFSVIACAILFYMALNYIDMLKQGVATLFRILGPFIWGLVIVYLLLPLVRFLQDALRVRRFQSTTRRQLGETRDGCCLTSLRGLSLRHILNLSRWRMSPNLKTRRCSHDSRTHFMILVTMCAIK